MKEFTIAVTGASGSACARRLIHALAAHPEVSRVNAILSGAALRVAHEELGPKGAGLAQVQGILAGDSGKVRWFPEQDVGAPIASGSHIVSAMAIVPCSTGTLGAIATGNSRNLIHRAAEVTLKERRKLVLGVREAPLSLIHLENMAAVTRAGALVLPITPAFYNHPRDIDDVVEQYTARVLDHLGLDHELGKRWGS